MVLTALAGGRLRQAGRRSGLRQRSVVGNLIAAKASPLNLVIGLKTGGAVLEVVDHKGGCQGTRFRPQVQRHAAILVTQFSLATRKRSHNRF